MQFFVTKMCLCLTTASGAWTGKRAQFLNQRDLCPATLLISDKFSTFIRRKLRRIKRKIYISSFSVSFLLLFSTLLCRRAQTKRLKLHLNVGKYFVTHTWNYSQFVFLFLKCRHKYFKVEKIIKVTLCHTRCLQSPRHVKRGMIGQVSPWQRHDVIIPCSNWRKPRGPKLCSVPVCQTYVKGPPFPPALNSYWLLPSKPCCRSNEISFGIGGFICRQGTYDSKLSCSLPACYCSSLRVGPTFLTSSFWVVEIRSEKVFNILYFTPKQLLSRLLLTWRVLLGLMF